MPHKKANKRQNLRASIPIKHCLALHHLFTVFTSLAFERLMRLAQRILFELEQLPKHVYREMTFGIFLLIDDCRRQSLFGGLSLEDLLFDRSSRDEAVYEACESDKD